MKRITATLLALVMVFSIANAALAVTYETEVKYGVNFRTGPSTDSKVIRMLEKGEDIHVIEQVNRYWLKVQTKDGRIGYISSNTKYTDYKDSGSSNLGTIVTTGDPWLRSAPSTDSKIYRSIPKGTRLTVLAKPNKYWIKVNYKGQTGYISTNYVNYVSGGSGSSGSSGNSSSSTSKADAIINTAKSLIGRAEYEYGVRDRKNLIFDCSSFTEYVFEMHGIELKWGTRYQKNAGRFVSKSNLKKGDLVFFSIGNSDSIGHVGIYIGNGDFIHITENNNGPDVHINNLNKGYWEDHYKTARRVL